MPTSSLRLSKPKTFPIPENRKEIYSFYRLAFDENGCPMKDMGDGKLVFHPILPPYLIVDYILMYQKTKDESWLNLAEYIADIVSTKSDQLQGAKVFLYRPESGLSAVPKTFYSALTQAWYIKALCLLSKYRPQKYKESIEEIFNSLLLPIGDGGVLIKRDFGWIVEEYPYEPPFYTLNGWLTVLRWIVQSRKILDKFNIEYQTFLNRNLDAVERLLPLYDAEFCLNSRYQLTGFSRVKIVFSKAVNYKCHGASVDIPGEGEGICNLEPKEDKSRWEYYLERSEARVLQFNVVLSLISIPKPNIFKADITVDKECSVKVFLAQGEYRPDSTGMPTESWKEISEIKCMPGRNKLTVDLPFDGKDMFAYPTNFKKFIDGTMYNGYHFVHIVDLGELYRFSKREILKTTALDWLSYYNRWSELPYLEGYSLTHYQYGEGFEEYIHRNFFDGKA